MNNFYMTVCKIISLKILSLISMISIFMGERKGWVPYKLTLDKMAVESSISVMSIFTSTLPVYRCNSFDDRIDTTCTSSIQDDQYSVQLNPFL